MVHNLSPFCNCKEKNGSKCNNSNVQKLPHIWTCPEAMQSSVADSPIDPNCIQNSNYCSKLTLLLLLLLEYSAPFEHVINHNFSFLSFLSYLLHTSWYLFVWFCFHSHSQCQILNSPFANTSAISNKSAINFRNFCLKFITTL